MMLMETLIRKSFQIGNEQIRYYRPSQVRKVPLKAVSNRGFMPSLKPYLKGLILEYESQLEHDFLLLLDHDPNCIDLQPQPAKILYKTESGREATLYPDCWAIFKDGREFLFDVKSENRYRKMTEDVNWKIKIKAIQKFCKKRGWTYQVITERKIRCTRLDIIKDLVVSAKHFSPAKVKKNLGTFNSSLENFLQESSKKFRELIHLLSSVLPLSIEEVISFLKYKIYFGHINIDWNEPLEETIFNNSENHLIPTYSLPIFLSTERDVNSIVIAPEKSKVSRFTKKERQKFDERLNLITPIINKFGKEGKKSIIRKYCEKNNLPFRKTYDFYLLWRKEGEDGLIPKWAKKHNKSHLDPRVEKVLQESILDWNYGEWQQIQAGYKEFCAKCYKLGIKPASLKTFRRKIDTLTAVERRGKFKPRSQINIKRGLSGTYREGRYPCAVIQMDHTLLDIWLVDSYTKQPLGRPWITVGVDVFSRAVWGFFISFDTPSRESVTQAIFNGLISKDQLQEWRIFESQIIEDGIDPEQFKSPCGGFPTRIQVDNGRDFRANLVKEFCMNNNITLEFRPVKTPEFGGFIESVWDTINDAIRGAKLAGRVFSRPKSREPVKRPKFKIPPNYNAKKDAKLTLEEFHEWLFTYLIVNYSTDTKARQNHSPNEIWDDGLRGKNQQPMGGALRLLTPSEYLKFDYQSKITVSAVISQKGFRYKNILYSSNWLNEARKERILKDGQKYEFKVSHWDIRRAYILNPQNNDIKVLEAYNYDGDDRITKLVLRGLGKEPGYISFPISMNMINYFRKKLGTSEYDDKDRALIMERITKKMREKAKLTKKEQKYLDNLIKTEEGREKLSAVSLMTQMDLDSIDLDSFQILNEKENQEAKVQYEESIEEKGLEDQDEEEYVPRVYLPEEAQDEEEYVPKILPVKFWKEDRGDDFKEEENDK